MFRTLRPVRKSEKIVKIQTVWKPDVFHPSAGLLKVMKIMKLKKKKKITFFYSVDLETKLWSHNFSQKINKWICFSILTTWIYLKLEFGFQVFRSHQDRKQICSFLGEFYGSTILFRDLLTFSHFTKKES